MIKIFIPQTQKTTKTAIRGLWRNDKGHLFYDYIDIEYLNWTLEDRRYLTRFYIYLDQIKKQLNQEAIFYQYQDKAYIYYGKDKIDVLNIRTQTTAKPGQARRAIKEAIKAYGGITIYKRPGEILIEAWTK